MKDHPMLMSAPMVRAILAGTKTQTRRVLKQQPPANTHKVLTYHHPDPRPHYFAWIDPGEPSPGAELSDWCRPCPYGQPGDRLWVREAWAAPHAYDHLPPRLIPQDARIHFAASEERGGLLWRPSIHMPRWASRITLEATGVRVERLQDISRADAIAEGVRPLVDSDGPNYWTVDTGFGSLNAPTAQHCYELLWNWINGPESWDANPWVWVIDFKRLGEPA